MPSRRCIRPMVGCEVGGLRNRCAIKLGAQTPLGSVFRFIARTMPMRAAAEEVANPTHTGRRSSARNRNRRARRTHTAPRCGLGARRSRRPGRWKSASDTPSTCGSALLECEKRCGIKFRPGTRTADYHRRTRDLSGPCSSPLGMAIARKTRGRTLQLALFRHGGRRAGAGRKPKGEQALCPRYVRPRLASRVPVLVTIRWLTGLPSLRCATSLRVVHGSVQSNHLHLIVEARDAAALARDMCGLLVRIERGLNRAWGRRGKILADRYHACVLHNAKKHGSLVRGVDPFSSGPWFDGWRELLDEVAVLTLREQNSPFATARTWLLSVGWRRHGRIGLGESPLPAARRATGGTRRAHSA